MNNSTKHILSTVFLLTLITLTPSTALAEDDVKALQAEINRLKAKVQQLEAENKALKAKLSQSDEKIKSAQAKAKDAENKAREIVEKAQAITQRDQNFYLDIEKDTKTKQTNITSINTKMQMLKGATPRNHFMNLSATHPTDNPAAAKSINLHIQSFFTGRAYSDAQTLDININGRQLTLKRSEYDRVPRRTAGRKPRRIDDEMLTFTLSRQQLQTLINAKSATGTLGPATFKFTTAQLSSLRALAQALKIN